MQKCTSKQIIVWFQFHSNEYSSIYYSGLALLVRLVGPLLAPSYTTCVRGSYSTGPPQIWWRGPGYVRFSQCWQPKSLCGPQCYQILRRPWLFSKMVELNAKQYKIAYKYEIIIGYYQWRCLNTSWYSISTKSKKEERFAAFLAEEENSLYIFSTSVSTSFRFSGNCE